MRVGLAAALDAVVVLVFAAVGRASHDRGYLPLVGESSPVLGVLATAWPFLVGTAVGWLLVRSLSHRWPIPVGPGVTVVASTVVGGMLLRALTGQGAAPAFVVVATLVLGAFLLGWRAVTARRLRW